MATGDPLILGETNQSSSITELDDSSGRGLNVYSTGWGVAGLGGTQGVGLYGTAGTGGVGVYGVGTVDDPNSYAGLFFGGKVDVLFGNFTVWFGSKSAAVRHPDGSNRLLYSVESPECWFEDFGRGRLVRGSTKVRLDRDFAAVVRTGDYHVFLTPEGDSQGLYVSGKSKTGFEVREQQNGKSGARFSYRIVAKRKDVPGPRLPKVKLPKLAKLPKPSRRKASRVAA